MHQPPSPFEIQKFDTETKLGIWRVQNEAAIANGRVVVNTTILASGGAIVALLALLGTLLGKEAAHRELIPGITHIICWFAYSLFLALLSTAVIYLSSLCFATEAKFIAERKDAQAAKWERCGDWLGSAGIVIGALAIIAFAIGGWAGLGLLRGLR